jgi:predicted transcriptional regulator
MFRDLDDLDKALLQRVSEIPGLCIREVIEPYFTQRSETPLRTWIRALSLRGLISLKAEKDRIRCYPASNEGSDGKQ